MARGHPFHEGRTARDQPVTGPRVEGDPAEANRGLGQERVDEPGPGPQQRPLDPAAGGPGQGVGPSSHNPKHQNPMQQPAQPPGHGTYGQAQPAGPVEPEP